MSKHVLVGFSLAILICSARSVGSQETVDDGELSAAHYRSIGSYRGGRSTAGTGVPSQPYTFYMRATGGGVWKTTDAGESWQNISDGFNEAARQAGAQAVVLPTKE